MASIALSVVGCIDYLAYGAIFTCAGFYSRRREGILEFFDSRQNSRNESAVAATAVLVVAVVAAVVAATAAVAVAVVAVAVAIAGATAVAVAHMRKKFIFGVLVILFA